MIVQQIAEALRPVMDRLEKMESKFCRRRILFEESKDADMQALPWARSRARSVEASTQSRAKKEQAPEETYEATMGIS